MDRAGSALMEAYDARVFWPEWQAYRALPEEAVLFVRRVDG